MNPNPSYHDVHVTTAQIPRTSIFDLPFDLLLTCTRAGGWELTKYDRHISGHLVVAGEYADNGLLVDVDGTVIVDSLTKKAEPNVIGAATAPQSTSAG